MNTYRQQAERGDAEADFKLGLLYEYGYKPTSEDDGKDYAQALRWFRKAAEQDHADARLELGKMYLDGKGVERDYAEAARWLRCPKLMSNSFPVARQAPFPNLPSIYWPK